RWFVTVASQVAPRLDSLVYRLTRGRRLATPASVPTFFVTTTGRRTGVPRRVALSYLRRDGDFIVVGTNFGKRATPEWALNLAANPQVQVEMVGEEFRAEAWAVPIEEQSVLWEAFDAMWPAYAAYRERATDRPILMFRLVSL
ncbi:MAG: nitroreductase family deazaflavin-dependent oxidoreductase, partial [Acidimicrobiia bacterium]